MESNHLSAVCILLTMVLKTLVVTETFQYRTILQLKAINARNVGQYPSIKTWWLWLLPIMIVQTNLFQGQHCHRHRQEGIDKGAVKKLLTVGALCLCFMIGEGVGGYLSNSLAIATDAAHLLTDLAGFMVSLIAIWLARKPPTKKLHYGWYRAEVIGALLSVLLIWVITGVLVFLAIERIINETYEIDAEVMLITSGVGVVMNLIIGVVLFQHGHTHERSSSAHSHSDSKEAKVHSYNINVRAAFIHAIGDLFQSMGVFIAAIMIYFKEDWVIVDPICTFFFSLLVLCTTHNILKDVLRILMQGSPNDIESSDVIDLLLGIEGVEKVHSLRIWALTLDKIFISCHIAIAPGANPLNILMEANSQVHDKYNIFESTFQIEEVSKTMDECNQCKNPN